MPQISLYIDEPTLKKVENAALRQHISISKWVAEQIRSRVEPIYPKDFEKLFGSISD
jgi:predicted HicB family RNase H-like nuclease